MEEARAPLDRRPPGDQIALEAGAIAVLVRMLELIERMVLGVEQLAVPAEEVVVDGAVTLLPPLKWCVSAIAPPTQAPGPSPALGPATVAALRAARNDRRDGVLTAS